MLDIHFALKLSFLQDMLTFIHPGKVNIFCIISPSVNCCISAVFLPEFAEGYTVIIMYNISYFIIYHDILKNYHIVTW